MCPHSRSLREASPKGSGGWETGPSRYGAPATRLNGQSSKPTCSKRGVSNEHHAAAEESARQKKPGLRPAEICFTPPPSWSTLRSGRLDETHNRSRSRNHHKVRGSDFHRMRVGALRHDPLVSDANGIVLGCDDRK